MDPVQFIEAPRYQYFKKKEINSQKVFTTSNSCYVQTLKSILFIRFQYDFESYLR